jgi:hypothetical protein
MHGVTYLLTYQEEHRFPSVTSQLVGACTVPGELPPLAIIIINPLL